jgi:hypothetical protein
MIIAATHDATAERLAGLGTKAAAGLLTEGLFFTEKALANEIRKSCATIINLVILLARRRRCTGLRG